MSTALDMALLYAKRGLHVVPIHVPLDGDCSCPPHSETRDSEGKCKSPGKHPTIHEWQKNASVDTKRLHQWFDGKIANLGIACGPSGVVTIDVDPRNGGDRTFAALVEELGPLPATLTDDSGGGGWHLTFKRPTGELLSKLGNGVDLLRDGRQFVVEPSVHASGGTYRWRDGLAPDQIELAELPQAWIDRMRRKVSPPPPPRAASPSSDERKSKRARAYLEKMDGGIQGSHGSDATFLAALAMRLGFDLPHHEAVSLLLEIHNPKCTPPWSEKEIEKKVADAAKSTKTPGYLLDEDKSPDHRKPGDLPAGLTVIDKDQGEIASPPRWPIEFATGDWVTTKLPPREHLLVDTRTDRGAIDKTGVWLLGGAGGAGKSYLTIGLALSIVNGTPWLGTFAPARPGRTLIIAAEDSCEDIRRRAHAIAAAEHLDPAAMERFHVLPIHDRVTSLVSVSGDSYAPSDDTKSLCAELADREPYDLVIVDPYGRIAGVSVDADNAAAAATISALAMISTAARGLVIGVAHTSMRSRIAARNGAPEGATSIRGATGQTDYARGVLTLERDKDVIWLSVPKSNHVAQWERVGLRRGEHGELVRLSDVELSQLAKVDATDEKQAKRHTARAERDRLDDEAARRVISTYPEASARDLKAILMGNLHIGSDRAQTALVRARL